MTQDSILPISTYPDGDISSGKRPRAVRERGFFQFQGDGNQDLVLKNESTSNGTVYLEGTQREIRTFLKSNMVVKPICMFDETLEVRFKVMYQEEGGTYSDLRSKETTISLSQVVSDS